MGPTKCGWWARAQDTYWVQDQRVWLGQELKNWEFAPGWARWGKVLDLTLLLFCHKKNETNTTCPLLPSCCKNVMKASKASGSCITDIRTQAGYSVSLRALQPRFKSRLATSEPCVWDELFNLLARHNHETEMLIVLVTSEGGCESWLSWDKA